MWPTLGLVAREKSDMEASEETSKLEIEETLEGVSVTLSDGDSGNYLGFSDISRIGKVLDDAESAGKKWVLLRQDGSDFCLGREHGRLNDSQRQVLIGLVEKLQTTNVVTLAAASGRCEAFGVGLFALADISIAAESTTFRFPEILEGFAPAIVATWLFDSAPYKQALNWILTGEQFNSEQALRYGMATEVVKADQLTAATNRVIERLSQISLEALSSCKGIARVMRENQLDLASRRSISLKWFGK